MNTDEIMKKVKAYGQAVGLATDLYEGDGKPKNVRQVLAAFEAVREALDPKPAPPDPRQVKLTEAMVKIAAYTDARISAGRGSRESLPSDNSRTANAERTLRSFLLALIQDAVDLQEIRDFARSQIGNAHHDYPDYYHKLRMKVTG